MSVAENHFLSCHSKSFPALAPCVSVLILMVVMLTTASCGTLAQATGIDTPGNLNLSGSLPAVTVNESYNTVLAVGGGSTPYQFSVKAGTLPPGVSLNPTTGTISGKPSTTGTFSFEVVVTDSPRRDQGSRAFAIVVGSGGGGATVTVNVSPASTSLSSNQKEQFTASVSGTSTTGVTWSATSGSISATGLFTAPAVTVKTIVAVTAASVVESSKLAIALITVDPVAVQALQITTANLPQGQQGDTYSEAFSATGGTAPYNWSVSAGAPPAGITMNRNGEFAGMPTAAGTSNFSVTVTDTAGKTASGSFSATVVAGSNFDGPAELPRATVPSAMADTPAPGTVINVNAGGNLQSALNNANCGDVIQLQAGATFTGQFIVPAKNCDTNHWIIVRTSAPDSALPAEGQRATPCYAGVASLQGRPQYSCANPKNVMAKVEIQIQGDGPFKFAPGANYYRFTGLEITRPAGTPGPAALMVGQGTADHIVVDRSWLHGAPQDETHLGVNLSGMTNVALIDSYFSDFHCIANTGACTDAHAVAGGIGSTQDGPFKIQDNFLEASSEGILFGGGAATLSPADITITNNHFWKPWQWMPGSPNFIGGPNGNPFVVKNHLELKNAVRVLVEANLMENNWGGFSQTGYGILLTPKNQHTASGADICPLCQVTDVTIRYSQVSHAGGGIGLATSVSGNGTDGAPALAGTRWSIHDVVLDDISKRYVGSGEAFQVSNGWPTHPLNTITINHVTAFPDTTSHMMSIGNIYYATAPMYGFVFTNNMMVTGRYPIWNTGGSTSCSSLDVPVSSIRKCFTTATFTDNALIAAPQSFPPSAWPSDNLFPATAGDAMFVNYNNGDGGNYELQPNSPYKNKGTDGKDLGADIVGLNAALANVE
jgi:hypothetical protein